jgi:energy-coupling factor transporter ATP-binding protein EcfA2
MHIRAISINNFRSILSTGWITLSHDEVTCIVGMNESGKTSLLEALHCALGNQKLTDFDLRYGAPLPTVVIRFELEKSIWSALGPDWPSEVRKLICKYFEASKGDYEMTVSWSKTDDEYEVFRDVDNPSLKESLSKIGAATQSMTPEVTSTSSAESPTKVDYFELLSVALESLEPVSILFSDEKGLLPDAIDIPANNVLKGEGAQGANNFLKVAQIELAKLNAGSDAERANLLGRATKNITKDFQTFWSQHIGKDQGLRLECEIHQKRASSTEPGHPYLQFWITDGDNRLRPSQRSKGLRWFLSFYLQLSALQLSKGNQRVFLLDEPGANLHETAQQDVLKLINKIRTKMCGVMYTTHSPHLVEIEKLYRILTVERAGDNAESPSVVMNALANASSAGRETLSPIYSKMGVDFWRQTVIDRRHNVLLEEPSGYFYIKAFWKLLNTTEAASFIPCTGVNNIPQLALMFAGWGLGFVVVVDDDASGRAVFKDLKVNLFGSDEALALSRVFRIKDCEGIEDIFSQGDFRKLVLKSNANYVEKNSKYLKTVALSKPLLACQFLLSVEAGTISIDSLDSDSKRRIAELVGEIKNRLQ